MMKISDLPEDKLLNAVLLISMTKIFDDENIYDLKDYRDSEIQNFIDNLSVEQFNLISEWFKDIPSVSLKLQTICEKCSQKHTEEVKGFANFF